MTKARVYLDWNATAPLRAEAQAAMIASLEIAGNPSSIHTEGRAARRIVEQARAQVARLTGADTENVTFTSGGTEANTLALTPYLQNGKNKAPFERLLISAIEHPSVRAGGRFRPDQVEELPVTADGVIDTATLAAALRSGGRALVSVMIANNETGVVQPVSEVARLAHEAGGLLHADAVQAAGKLELNISSLEADLISLSAHKIGGPKGIGALIRRSDAIHIPDALVKGGGQERGLRGGTENVIGIAGFGAAAEAVRREIEADIPRMAGLRDKLEDGLRAVSPDAVVFGGAVKRLPNTTLFAVPGIKAETAVIALDLDGVAVSSGAACSSGKVQASHVLAAMGVATELALGEIRVTLGYGSTEADVEKFLETWKKLSKSLGKGQRGIAA